MDQDASSERDDLGADLYNFDETCRLLQARSEKRLQQVKSARAAENEDIELKARALLELKAKHDEELQALEAALQSGNARKRKHEEEIQQLEHRISGFKSWKPNSEELPAEAQPETHQTSAPTILTHHSEKHAVNEPGSKFDGAPQGRTHSPRVTQPATIFEKDLRAHTLPRTHDYPGNGVFYSRVDSLSKPIHQGNSKLFGQQNSTAMNPVVEDARSDHHGSVSLVQGLQPPSLKKTVHSAQTAWDYLYSIFPDLIVEFMSQPTDPEYFALLNLPVKRELVLNPSRQDATWPVLRPRNVPAFLCHITGVERQKSCNRCQTKLGMFDRCVMASSDAAQGPMTGQCSNCFIDQCGQCNWDDGQRPAGSHESAEYRLSMANRCLPLSRPRRDDIPTEDNGPNQLQPEEYSDQDELLNSSYFEGKSDEEFTAQDGELKGTGAAFVPNAQAQPLTQKRIPYEEVYEMARDPQANRKHWIIDYPPGSDNWYILRCERHDLNWFNNPLPAAGKHVSASNHKCSTGNANSAIKVLGELVEDCDQQKAEASNAEYSNAVAKGYKPRNTMNTNPSRERQKTKPQPKEPTNGSAQTSDHESAGVFKGVIDPTVGKVYHAWWVGEPGEPSLWYPVVILPYSGDCGWKEVGLTGNLFTSGLVKEIPTCFKTVKYATGAEEESLRLTWAEGYQDGGPEVRSRKFPCLFLHPPLEIPNAGEEIVLGPQDKLLAFLPAKDLRHQSTDLPSPLCYAGLDAYKGLVQAFQARQEAIRAKQNAASEQEAGEAFRTQASSTRGQQQPDATASAKILRHPDSLPRYDDQELRLSIEHNLPMPGNRHRDISDGYGLDTHHPRESLQVQLKNNSGPSPNSREGSHSSAKPWASQVASRQAQLMGSESQNVGSPFALQQFSSKSQTAVCTSQSPRAASALPGEPRGPTALRAIKETEKCSDGFSDQDKVPGLRQTVNTAATNVAPNSAGQTPRASSYSAML